MMKNFVILLLFNNYTGKVKANTAMPRNGEMLPEKEEMTKKIKVIKYIENASYCKSIFHVLET